jgi:quercetin dioxygenase-like cupin family protein
MAVFPEFVDRLPLIDLDLPGVTGRLLQAEEHQVAFFRFDQETVVPDHSHGAQWEVVVAGEVLLKTGGEERVYRVGESFFIADGQVHGAVVRAGFRSVAFFAQADRYAVRRS